MIHYIYFVKCQGCEDEHFDFFADAKAHAVSCLDLHPIITQVEVDRNDFGECVDSRDLGTVWSWEEVMNDAKVTDETTFSKADTLGVDIDNDPEFLAIDNSLEEDAYTRDLAKRLKSLTSDSDAGPKSKKALFGKDKNYIATWKVVQASFPNLTVKDGFTSEVEAANYVRDHGGLSKLKTVKNESFERKAIPEDMTIKDLVEAMEENEDQVECVGCEELYDKTDCEHLENHGWLCPDCQDTVVECSWCKELFDKSECREEVDLGYLCGRCESAIKSRGETLTFRENFDYDVSNCVDSSNMEIWGIEPISAGESVYHAVLLKRYENVSLRELSARQAVTDDMYKIGGCFVFMFGKDGNPMLDSWNTNQLNKLGHCEIIFDDSRYDAAIEAQFNKKDRTANEDLEWHTYKITFATEANPDNEQTITFKTWQSDVEYAWRKSDSNIPHTTIKRIELVEDLTGNTSAVTEAVTLTPQQKDEIMCCVAVSFETGHQAFEDFRDFKREYPDLSSDVLQMLWAYYNDLVAMGPAGFYEQFKDVYDFDPMFVAEYGDMVEESFDHISDFKNNLLACPECGKNAFDSETEICLECGSGPLSEDFLRNK